MRALLWDADWLGTLAGYPGGLAGPSEVALHARLFADAAGVAMDVGRSVLYVAERQGHTIRHIDMLAAMPVVSTAAGMYGRSGYRDGGCAAALFAAPSGLVFDDVARILYVADAGNHVVRAVAVEAGTVSTIAGIPQEYGFQGDGGLATEAWLQAPEALVLGNDGSLYVADTGNHRVRRIDENGLIRTVLGDGTPASSGSRGLAREMPLDSPKGLAVDAFGNLFVSSSSSVRLVTAGSDGIASADDEAITIYGLLPHDEFPESQTRCLTGLAVLAQLDDPSSQVLVLDACAGLVIKLVRTAR